MTTISLKNLDQVLTELEVLAQAKNIQTSNWSVYRILQHCAQTIEYSMSGYPTSKPKWLQLTVGKLAIFKFLKQGYMSHDLAAPVPGSPELTYEGSTAEGISILKASILKFKQFNGPLKPHLFFGELSKDEYNQYFAMHIANHFSEISYL